MCKEKARKLVIVIVLGLICSGCAHEFVFVSRSAGGKEPAQQLLRTPTLRTESRSSSSSSSAAHLNPMND